MGKVCLLLFLGLCVFFLAACDLNDGPVEYELTVKVLTGEGSVEMIRSTMHTLSYSFPENETVTLKSVPEPGWEFLSWAGDVSEEDKEKSIIQVLMDGDREIGVSFVEKTDIETGDAMYFTAGSEEFFMRLAPAAAFPMGLDDSRTGQIDHVFWIAETPVSYGLWYEVRVWAEEQGYTFAGAGREGSGGSVGQSPSGARNEPVTEISWFDSLIWCNALSEYRGYEPVYTRNGEILKEANLTHDPRSITVEDTDGFRLPTHEEWELSARYLGEEQPEAEPLRSQAILLDDLYWTPGTYASGATAPYNDVEASGAAAWFKGNSGGSTQAVGQKPEQGNALGLFDMSGNVWEWCCDALDNLEKRVYRVGSWTHEAYQLQVGLLADDYPSQKQDYLGFRIVRTP